VNVHDRVREFLLTECDWVGAPEDLTDDMPLANALLDSIALTKLVVMLEEDFGIEVEDDDIHLDNFGTLARIVRYVEERL
jgi:acyl carrier protein